MSNEHAAVPASRHELHYKNNLQKLVNLP